jgi:regulatory protein
VATPTVTALRQSGRRVAVELDGAPWRTMPSQAVVDAGLAVGVPLDREHARMLARSLRRQRASELTVRALAQRDRSRSELDLRLEQSGVREGERRDALGRAVRAGLVDDERFAATRARTLADRGAGDLLVLDDLARRGIPAKVARAAVSTLEAEHARAARVVAARGRSLRTLRYLASRGFAPESLDDLVAEAEDRALR